MLPMQIKKVNISVLCRPDHEAKPQSKQPEGLHLY